ncbi:MAG: tRNA threonylcarbamoyladenosine dehydratase [Phycisphaerales bacterium]|nr:tRNA threonylcarbamoyladenosine dehydratase [Phycisphaerales bacterium]
MTTDTSWLSRTELLIGIDALHQLTQAHVLVIGMGGVGSFAAEFIARSGVGRMTIVDGDVVDPSNRNRQLPALAINHGQSKVHIMAERLLAINPELELKVVNEFVRPEAINALLDTDADYIIDAIDSLTPKLTCIKAAYRKGMRIVSSMGAGGKLDPTQLQVTDIAKTYNCPFAQQIRKQLKMEGIKKGIKVVFSPELPDKNSIMRTDGTNFKKSAYGTISYLPAVFGATAASVVIRDLMTD